MIILFAGIISAILYWSGVSLATIPYIVSVMAVVVLALANIINFTFARSEMQKSDIMAGADMPMICYSMFVCAPALTKSGGMFYFGIISFVLFVIGAALALSHPAIKTPDTMPKPDIAKEDNDDNL